MSRHLSLRRSVAAEPEPEEFPQYLTFRLGDETYASDILHVREIIEYGEITEVPLMPAFLRGVINLRGRVLPVIDLAIRFGRSALAISRRTSIVIVEVPHGDGWQDLGVIVDSVDEVLEFRPEQIEAAPPFGINLRRDFIQGIAKHADRFIVVLDLNAALSMDEMTQWVEHNEHASANT